MVITTTLQRENGHGLTSLTVPIRPGTEVTLSYRTAVPECLRMECGRIETVMICCLTYAKNLQVCYIWNMMLYTVLANNTVWQDTFNSAYMFNNSCGSQCCIGVQPNFFVVVNLKLINCLQKSTLNSIKLSIQN